MDRVFDALVTAAAADITRHRFAYLIASWLWIFHQQCCGLHDLAGLAIAALRNIDLAPGLLNRMITRRMQAFDRRNLSAGHVGDRGDAGAYGLLVHDHRACAAQRLAAAKFRAGQSGFVTEKPEQREIRVAIPALFVAVN